MKVLIVGCDSVGGVVFSTPVIRAIKTQLDNAEVHYLTQQKFAPVLQENPYIDKILFRERSFWARYRQLRFEKYPVIVDLRSDLETLLLTFFLQSKAYRLPVACWRKWLMVRLKINQLSTIHRVDQMMMAVKPMGVKPDDLGLDYFIPESDEVPQEWFPENFRKGYVAFYVGASYSTRKLPVSRMIELCDKINKPIVLLGSQEDFPDGEIIEKFFLKTGISHDAERGLRELNKKTIVYNGCGKFSINQIASIIRQSRYVFLFDGDFIPIASAFRKEIFSIWGNTIPLFGEYPYHTRFTILENNKISCRPCSSSGFDKCPQGHFKCMKENSFDFYLT